MRFLICWMFMGWSSADSFQEFFNGLVKIQKDYESSKKDLRQYLNDIEDIVLDSFTAEEIQDIESTESPHEEAFSKMLKKHWVQLERKIFVKILLLALEGRPLTAMFLLEKFENILFRSDVPYINTTDHPYVILMFCIELLCDRYNVQPQEYQVLLNTAFRLPKLRLHEQQTTTQRRITKGTF